jgi:hypothetical protein
VLTWASVLKRVLDDPEVRGRGNLRSPRDERRVHGGHDVGFDGRILFGADLFPRVGLESGKSTDRSPPDDVAGAQAASATTTAERSSPRALVTLASLAQAQRNPRRRRARRKEHRAQEV